jgi:hypothetical protein
VIQLLPSPFAKMGLPTAPTRRGFFFVGRV